MDLYKVLFARDAESDLRRVPFPLRRQINQRIFRLKAVPVPGEAQRISESGAYRLLIGGWRVLYEVDESARTVTIYAIQP